MLVFWNLWALVRRHTRFLIPMLLSGVATTIGILFALSSANQAYAQRQANRETSRAYILGVDSSSLEAGLSTLTAREDVVRVQAAVQGEDFAFLANVYGQGKSSVELGAYFTEEDSRQGLAQVVIPEELAASRNLHVGDECVLCGQPFTVIGIGALSDTVEIPYAALQNRSGVYALSVVTAQAGDDAEQAAFASFLADTFHVDVETVELPEPPGDFSLPADVKMIIFMSLFGVLGIAVIYMCFLEERKKTLSIYTLVGCRRGRLTALLLEELAVLSVGIYLVAVLLSRPFLHLLSWISPRFAVVLTAGDYLKLFCLFAGLLFVLVGVQLLRFFRRTPAERRRSS